MTKEGAWILPLCGGILHLGFSLEHTASASGGHKSWNGLKCHLLLLKSNCDLVGSLVAHSIFYSRALRVFLGGRFGVFSNHTLLHWKLYTLRIGVFLAPLLVIVFWRTFVITAVKLRRKVNLHGNKVFTHLAIDKTKQIDDSNMNFYCKIPRLALSLVSKEKQWCRNGARHWSRVHPEVMILNTVLEEMESWLIWNRGVLPFYR